MICALNDGHANFRKVREISVAVSKNLSPLEVKKQEPTCYTGIYSEEPLFLFLFLYTIFL
jgi:hypothetical protein